MLGDRPAPTGCLVGVCNLLDCFPTEDVHGTIGDVERLVSDPEPPPTVGKRLSSWWGRRRNLSKVAIVIGGLWATACVIGVVSNTASSPNSDSETGLAPAPTLVQVTISREICAARFHEWIWDEFNRDPNVLGNPYGLAFAAQTNLLTEVPDCTGWHWQIELPPEIDCEWLLGPRTFTETGIVRPIDMQICVLRNS